MSSKCAQVQETRKQDSNRSINVDKSSKQNYAIETADMNNIDSAINFEINVDLRESTISSSKGNSADNELQFSLPPDDNFFLNEVFHFGEICAQQLYNGKDEEFYHEDNSFNSFMSSNMNNSLKCLVTNMDESEKVSFVSVNEHASFLVKVANEVTLIPWKLTKVSLICAENTCKDLLLMNDRYKCTDVNLDNMLVKPQEGRFVVYATSAIDKAVRITPRESFCSACILENSTLSVTESVFTSLLEQTSNNSFENELGKVDCPENKSELIKMLNKHRKPVALTGEKLGRKNVIEHRINLIDNSRPASVPNFRLPVSRRNIVENLIKDMENQGIIKESLSPYNLPLLLVLKKDGTWRIVIDYRRLNKDTIPDRMPMPNFDEVLAQLNGAKLFSALDLLSGYHQVPLSEESKQCTAFSTHNQHWQFEVMPFGLCNAPLAFDRLMHQILGNMKNVFVYLDDIIIFSRNKEEHFQILEEVLSRLKGAGLKIKLSKCQFLKRELIFLGHVVGPNGIKMQDRKIKTIINYPPPKNAKAVKRFLGITGYYCPFVRNFATIAYPLTRLLRKDVKFKWEKEEESVFHDLKS